MYICEGHLSYNLETKRSCMISRDDETWSSNFSFILVVLPVPFIKPTQSACRCEGHNANVTATAPSNRVANLLDGAGSGGIDPWNLFLWPQFRKCYQVAVTTNIPVKTVVGTTWRSESYRDHTCRTSPTNIITMLPPLTRRELKDLAAWNYGEVWRLEKLWDFFGQWGFFLYPPDCLLSRYFWLTSNTACYFTRANHGDPICTSLL